MDHPILYRPFHTDKWFVPFVSGAGVLFAVFAGYSLFRPHWSVLILLLFSFVSFWLAKVLYDHSSILVLFEQDGLRIVGDKRKCHQYFSWNAFEYAYYSRSYKGHLFLVLSPRELDQREVKAYTNRGAISLSLCVDPVVVIYIGTQLTEMIKDVVDQKVPHRAGDS